MHEHCQYKWQRHSAFADLASLPSALRRHAHSHMLCCTGSPFEAGRTHGAALASQIHRTLAALDASRAARGPGGSIASFLRATQHRDAMLAHTPELLEEINGIATGASANVDDVLCMSLMDEEWTFARDLYYATTQTSAAAQVATSPLGAAPGCTVIAQSSASGPAVISQTMDLSPALAGAQAVMHIAHSAPAVGTSDSSAPPASLGATLATAAGMLGLFGVNAAGVGCVVNNLATLPTSPRGLPVAAVIRGLLARSRCVADAVAFLHRVPHATGQAYTIGDATGVVQCWEADADGVAQVPVAVAAVSPAAVDTTTSSSTTTTTTTMTMTTTLLHGNHPLARASRWSDDSQEGTYAANTTHERCASARAAFAKSESPNASESAAACMARMQAALAQAPVSITIADGAARGCFTFCAATIVCAAPPQMHLAAGPPCSVPFVSIETADAALTAKAAAAAAPSNANANTEFTFGIIADTQYVNAADGSNFDGSVVRRHRQSLTILAQAQRSFRAMCAAAPADGTPALAAAGVASCSADPLPAAQTVHNFKCAVLLGDVLDGRAKDTALACVADVRRITDSEVDSAADDGTGKACGGSNSSDTLLVDHCPRVRVPWHFCVGNHDLTALSRDDVLTHLLTDEAKSRCAADRLYYDVAPHAGFRFVFLDAFDVSTIGGSSAAHRAQAHALLAAKNPNIGIAGRDWLIGLGDADKRFVPFNGAIGDAQLEWFQRTLGDARHKCERCFVFCHLPCAVASTVPACVLWNCERVLEIMHASAGTVVAYLAGHDHNGGYALDSAGIHHLTPPAPLECAVGQSAFGHISVRADRCELHWTGKLPPARWRCKPASDSSAASGDSMEAVVEWPTVMMYPTRQPNAAEPTRQPSSL